MREIVGGKISGGTITNNFKLLIDASRSGRLVDVYDRRQMQFMASCDLGRNWELMASGPTLFVIDDDGNCHMPNETELTGAARLTV